MKRIFLGMLFLSLVLIATACSDDAISNSDNNELVIGKNAFEWGIYLKYSSEDKVEFYVEPVSDDIRETIKESWKNSKSYKGTFGTVAIVSGKKKGEKADLGGTIKVYVNNASEPTVTLNIVGTYQIDDLPSYENSSFLIYTDNVLKQVQKDEWTSFKP